MAARKLICKDCAALPVDEQPRTPRKATAPGPRCVTHRRVFDARRKLLAHDAEVSRRYGLPRGFYAVMFEAQEGRCAICRIGNGTRRRLAVDHDHACCPSTPLTCGGRCVRGLCCALCNEYLGRVARDDAETFARGWRYLREPPAQPLLIAFTEEAA